MQHYTGKHRVFYHRYYGVWSTKHRYKVLTGAATCGRAISCAGVVT